MPVVAVVFSLLLAMAGAYYLFVSTAAERLAGVEGEAVNGRRQRLRRANGAAMVVLAGLFYAGFALDPDRWRKAYAVVWLAVVVVLAVVLALAIIDLRLTAGLRRTKP